MLDFFLRICEANGAQRRHLLAKFYILLFTLKFKKIPSSFEFGFFFLRGMKMQSAGRLILHSLMMMMIVFERESFSAAGVDHASHSELIMLFGRKHEQHLKKKQLMLNTCF